MDQQQGQSRQDADGMSDKNTDVTRSQNREGAAQADTDRTSSGESNTGANGHHGHNETGSHQEGQYDKDSSKPMMDKEGKGA